MFGRTWRGWILHLKLKLNNTRSCGYNPTRLAEPMSSQSARTKRTEHISRTLRIHRKNWKRATHSFPPLCNGLLRCYVSSVWIDTTGQTTNGARIEPACVRKNERKPKPRRTLAHAAKTGQLCCCLLGSYPASYTCSQSSELSLQTNHFSLTAFLWVLLKRTT